MRVMSKELQPVIERLLTAAFSLVPDKSCNAYQAFKSCLDCINRASPVVLFAVLLLGMQASALGAHWNATYYSAEPVWNVDYTGNQTVIWSSAGTGVDEPVWQSTADAAAASFSVSSDGLLTHLSIEGFFDYAELLYGWSVHTILELDGLPPGQTAQVGIAGSFEATTKCMVWTHSCPAFPTFEYDESWVQIGGVLSATVENTFFDQSVNYNVNALDASDFSCTPPPHWVPENEKYEVSDFHNSADFALFGGNTFTAGNGFTVELVSNFYISSYVDAGGYLDSKDIRSLAEGFGNQFNWQVTAALDSPIPIPDALWLMLSGLLGIMGVGRRAK